MRWRNGAAAMAACATGLGVVGGAVSYDASLTSAQPSDVVTPVGWWLLAVLLAVGTTALLHLRVRWIAALAWIALAVVLAIGGSLARTESERPPASLSTNSDLPSLMFLVLWIVCWTAAFLAATAGTALALFPLDRQQAEQQVTAERG